MGCACVIIGALWQVAHGDTIGWAIAGMNGAAVATGAQGEIGAHGAGGQVAATGATYVGGGQAGAQTAAGRLNQLQGHSGHSRAQQQPDALGNVATASKISSFFMILSSPSEAAGGFCFGRVV